MKSHTSSLLRRAETAKGCVVKIGNQTTNALQSRIYLY